eukprot:CAMPEP_0182931522 /NCGR_PEP_ID=MMETSP0105_2-20130417/28664_1 /TAXON_ID=81532 ORGANISM="Acanthoeca-like sp., Strain 10tr" /NCGR_SAMPLE_ID=MMETSP0105_2 /ASSEMBLY_ACC=CAM_ASM_000205 /LENGTH=71 /DNA_ID=CAMNT_0025069967 /DNA_START=18 /DNA_END=230 /DNA_ORIENTATION=+
MPSLERVGQFTERYRRKVYPAGQFFLNDQLGYTGVILQQFWVEHHEYNPNGDDVDSQSLLGPSGVIGRTGR